MIVDLKRAGREVGFLLVREEFGAACAIVVNAVKQRRKLEAGGARAIGEFAENSEDVVAGCVLRSEARQRNGSREVRRSTPETNALEVAVAGSDERIHHRCNFTLPVTARGENEW